MSAEFLTEFEARLTEALSWTEPSTCPTPLMQAAQDLCFAPSAKRSRPLLAVLFGKTLGLDEDPLADIGVAAELIHAASLLHDDVVDSGTLRRGRPTANARWGNLTAVLAGDLLLTRAFLALVRWPRPITDEAIDVVAQMTRSAMVEANGRGNARLSLDEWQYIADGKTGALLAWCGRAAAHLKGDMEAARRFERCGRLFGIAYQLADDLKDLQEAPAGKDRFADIKNGNPSYPVLLAASRSPALQQELDKAWQSGPLDPSEVHRLGEAVLCSDAPAATWLRVQQTLEDALDQLSPYRDHPGAGGIEAWAQQLFQRESRARAS